MDKKNDSLVTYCPDCGAEMNGLPWEDRNCPVCHVIMPAYYGHPEAPPELRERYKTMLPYLARAIVKATNTEDMLKRMQADRIRRAQ